MSKILKEQFSFQHKIHGHWKVQYFEETDVDGYVDGMLVFKKRKLLFYREEHAPPDDVVHMCVNRILRGPDIVYLFNKTTRFKSWLLDQIDNDNYMLVLACILIFFFCLFWK